MNLEGIKDIDRSNNNPFLLCTVKQSSKCGIQSASLVLLKEEGDTSMTGLDAQWKPEVEGACAPTVYQLQRSDIVKLANHCCLNPQKENPFQLLERADGIRLIRRREQHQLPETETAELFFSSWDYFLVCMN